MDGGKRGRSGGGYGGSVAPPKRPFQPKRDNEEDDTGGWMEEEEEDDQIPPEEHDVAEDADVYIDEMPSSAGAGELELSDEEALQLEQLGQVAAMFSKWERPSLPNINPQADDIGAYLMTAL